ncbi:amidohydrolase family protein [Nocardioides humi]|uniref:Amidohydrolase family protein n=1 Tax=Nocardioides humi TaxID=449461 RepID=A0ABN2BUH6_9ACTN|nr:amidohydrolase family protein [Nocardioides humi]
MTAPRLIDVHAHVFPRGLPDLAERTGDPRWPVLRIGRDASEVRVDGAAFRSSPHTLWDVGARLAALDAAGVEQQVVSPLPVGLVGWADAGLAGAWTAEMNEAVARSVADGDGRLLGLGCAPFGVDLRSHDAAAEAVARIASDPRLTGIEISTLPGGLELDDDGLVPFWEAVAHHDLPVFVHPTDGGAVRRRGQPFDFGVGMLTDTAMAATALVFGGVLDRLPRLRIALAHGCGALPWMLPRLQVIGRSMGHDPVRVAETVRRLWVDTLVFDPEHLRLLVRRFGADHLLLGTDDPLIVGQLDQAPALVRAAAADGVLGVVDPTGVLGGNARRFLGLD